MKDSQDYTVRIRFTFSLSFLFARERNTSFYERSDFMLYHGSNYLIENELEPRVSFDYRKLVYATEDYFYALVRAGKFNMERFLLKEDYEGKDKRFRLIEIVPGAFKETFDVEGYVYEVDDELFKPNGPLGYIAEQPVKICKAVKIHNVWEEILSNIEHYELIFYDEAEEYWKTVRGGKDGYLDRRAKRILKMKEV